MAGFFDSLFLFFARLWEFVVYNLYGSEMLELKILKKKMKQANSYDIWHSAAMAYDKQTGMENWKFVVESKYYDYKLIAHRLAEMKCAREKGDIVGLIFLLRAGLVRGLGGIGEKQLHLCCFVNTKKLIEDYMIEFTDDLTLLRKQQNKYFSPISKTRFFSDMLQAFGRTALCLSGGGSLGLYHLGVVKCLFEFGILPNVISGASIGALIAALLGVHTDDELPMIFEPSSISFRAFDRLAEGSAKRKVKRLLKHGYLMDVIKLKEFCTENIGNYTFLEAYQRSNRVINIAVASRKSSEVPWLLNYLTAPNVLVWSAALASCAMPGMYSAVDLLAKNHLNEIVRWNPSKHQWSDISLESEMPMTRLSELFNVNHFIVSQVNPHVVPFLSGYRRNSVVQSSAANVMNTLKSYCLSELHHRAMQLSIIIPSTFKFLQHALAQKYVGDITIVPEFTSKQALQFFSNPNETLAREAVVEGERATWPYISQIRLAMKIEMSLADCIEAVRIKDRKQNAKRVLMNSSSSSSNSNSRSSHNVVHDKKNSTVLQQVNLKNRLSM